jgi:hypothetical protein
MLDQAEIPIGGVKDPSGLQVNEPWGGIGAKSYEQNESGEFVREHAYSNVGGFG